MKKNIVIVHNVCNPCTYGTYPPAHFVSGRPIKEGPIFAVPSENTINRMYIHKMIKYLQYCILVKTS
jgi:hypothetical protein